MLKREDIRVRDPFIVFEDGVYYMCGTGWHVWKKESFG